LIRDRKKDVCTRQPASALAVYFKDHVGSFASFFVPTGFANKAALICDRLYETDMIYLQTLHKIELANLEGKGKDRTPIESMILDTCELKHTDHYGDLGLAARISCCSNLFIELFQQDWLDFIQMNHRYEPCLPTVHYRVLVYLMVIQKRMNTCTKVLVDPKMRMIMSCAQKWGTRCNNNFITWVQHLRDDFGANFNLTFVERDGFAAYLNVLHFETSGRSKTKKGASCVAYRQLWSELIKYVPEVAKFLPHGLRSDPHALKLSITKNGEDVA